MARSSKLYNAIDREIDEPEDALEVLDILWEVLEERAGKTRSNRNYEEFDLLSKHVYALAQEVRRRYR